MKTMTCKQLGGACDMQFHAETFEDMAAQSRKHGQEMATQSEPEHLKAMQEMKVKMEDPQAMQDWIQAKREEFDALPESEE